MPIDCITLVMVFPLTQTLQQCGFFSPVWEFPFVEVHHGRDTGSLCCCRDILNLNLNIESSLLSGSFLISLSELKEKRI